MKELGEGRFQIEVMAPSRRWSSARRGPPVQWVHEGSDVKQEQEVLDLVLAEVLRRYPQATLVDQGSLGTMSGAAR